jgi:hypothetical protein
MYRPFKPALVVAALLLAALGLAAERAWVTHRGGTSVDLFDTVTGAHEGNVSVGSSPVDIASDAADAVGPFRLFVANSGSHSVSVVQVDPLGTSATLTGGGTYGTFSTPSGIARTPWGSMVVVDQKITTQPGTPTGRSTIRFFSPTSYAILDDYRDASPSARYQDIVLTSNGRLWIADDGDQGVTVVRFPAGAAPFGFPKSLIYKGSGEFADFIHDAALVAPRRLATNGTNRVVVADGGSSNVVILDAEYPGNSEATAILQVVDVGPGVTCNDVEVVGNFAYVTTTGANNLHRIDLSDYTVTSTALAGTVAGLGASSDGSTLFVGAGSGGSLIQSLDLTAVFPPGAVAIPAFPAPGSFPFGFYASVRGASEQPGPAPGPGPEPDPPFVTQSNTTSTSNGSNNCGLLGLDLLLLLAVGKMTRSFYQRSSRRSRA